jgi:hypothetical protein
MDRYINIMAVVSVFIYSIAPEIMAKPQGSRYWQAPTKKDFADSEGGETAYHTCTLEAKNNGNATLFCLPLFIKGNDTSYSSSDGYRYIEEGKWIQRHDTLIFSVKRKEAGPGGSISSNEERKYKVNENTVEDILPPYQQISKNEFDHWLWKWGNENANRKEKSIQSKKP